MTAIPVLTAEVPGPGGAGDRLRPQGQASYVAGVTDEPLRFLTVPQLFDETVAEHGARPAAVFCAERLVLTWAELQGQADRVSMALLMLAMQRGDRIGIWSPTRSEWLAAMFGAARIGAVLVNLPPIGRVAELEAALNRTRCRALIMARSDEATDRLALLRGLAPELDRPMPKPVLDSRRLAHLKHVIVFGEGLVPAGAMRYPDFARMTSSSARRKLNAAAAAVDPDDVVNIQYTSGTTGPAKGAALSHFNVVNNARCAVQTMGLTERDKLCIAVPLHQGLGLVSGVLGGVASGATMVFTDSRFDPKAVLDAISRHRCTAMHGTPEMFEQILAHPERLQYDTSSLRTGIVTGAACDAGLLERMALELSMDEATVAYAAAETGPLLFQSEPQDACAQRDGTVGRVLPHLEAKVVADDGQIAPIGAVGELCCRGYSVMRGYWEDPRRSRDVLDASGWLRTGDLARIDESGYCRIVGRVGDAIRCGGQTMMASDIEAAIVRHPAVLTACVFGVPDAQGGEVPCACIVLRPGAAVRTEELQAWCRKHAGDAAVPVHVRCIDEVPRSGNGHRKKYLLKAAVLRELAQRRAAAAPATPAADALAAKAAR